VLPTDSSFLVTVHSFIHILINGLNYNDTFHDINVHCSILKKYDPLNSYYFECCSYPLPHLTITHVGKLHISLVGTFFRGFYRTEQYQQNVHGKWVVWSLSTIFGL
jgi:hypothetical protein